MQKIKLPAQFRPLKCENLIRIGKHNDGGYVIDKLSITNSDCLMSFGINDDWSFEQQFLELKAVPLFAFDASINKRHFQKKFLKSVRNLNLKHSFKNYQKFKDYGKFFNNRDRFHIEKFVGFDFQDHNMSLATIIKNYIRHKYHHIFFKIDIEGSEYRILDELISHQDITSGLVIEFHDLDINIEKVIKFIKTYKLSLSHIHANNFAPINQNIPLSIELGFSPCASLEKSTLTYPTAWDMPNNARVDDYQIEFI